MADKTFVINRIPLSSGEHEVHELRNCPKLTDLKDHLIIGEFRNCLEAVFIAKRKFPNWEIDGCQYCSPECFTR